MKTKRAPSNPRYQALIELLKTADTIWNASRVFFEAWDLSPSQFNVLNLLQGTPEGLSQTELSRQLIMHRSNATGLVDRLERRGLVKRKDAAGDRRAYRVVLTKTGSELLGSILPEYHAGAERLWSATPHNRIPALIAELRTVARKAEEIARARRARNTAPAQP